MLLVHNHTARYQAGGLCVMPVSLEFDIEIKLLLVVWQGVAIDDDLKVAYEQLEKDPLVARCEKELDDFRSITGNEITVTGLRWDARQPTASDNQASLRKHAVLAPRDLEYGLARMYQAYRDTSPVDVQVFRDASTAEAFLEIPAGYVDAWRKP